MESGLDVIKASLYCPVELRLQLTKGSPHYLVLSVAHQFLGDSSSGHPGAGNHGEWFASNERDASNYRCRIFAQWR